MRAIAFLVFIMVSSVAWACPSAPTTIKFAMTEQDWPPIFYRNVEGKPAGSWHVKLEKIFKEQLCADVEYSFLPWLRAQRDVETGRADAMITVATASRLEYSSPINTYFFSIDFHLLTRKNHPNLADLQSINTLEDLANHDFVYVSTLGNGWFENYIVNQGYKYQLLKNDEQSLRFLAAGRGDAMFDFPDTINLLIEDLDLTDQLVFAEPILYEIEFNIMISKQSPWHNYQSDIASAVQEVVR